MAASRIMLVARGEWEVSIIFFSSFQFPIDSFTRETFT